MSQRFHSVQPLTGDRGVLTGKEAHHLLHVMRASVGDRVVLFDGSGAEFEAEILSRGRNEVQLAIVGRREVNRELPFELSVGVSLPKGERQKWLVEKLTELGVRRLFPLVTERSVAQPHPNAVVRLQRTVVEACKQCGRNRLMQIAPATPWQDFVNSLEHVRRRLLAHTEGESLTSCLGSEVVDTLVAIGPEGGFTSDEVQAAVTSGWRPVSLGSRILRVETAAVSAVSCLGLYR